MMRDRRGTKKSNTVVQGIVANPLAAANAILHCDYGHFGVSPFHTISSARSPCHTLFTALGNHPKLQTARTQYCSRRSSISQALESCIQSPLRLSHFNHYACRSQLHRRTASPPGPAPANSSSKWQGSRWFGGLTRVGVCPKPTARKGVAEVS